MRWQKKRWCWTKLRSTYAHVLVSVGLYSASEKICTSLSHLVTSSCTHLLATSPEWTLGYHRHWSDPAALGSMFRWMAARQTSWKTWKGSSATFRPCAQSCKVLEFYQATHIGKVQGATLRIVNNKLPQHHQTPYALLVCPVSVKLCNNRHLWW